jgi:hypothetical protein
MKKDEVFLILHITFIKQWLRKNKACVLRYE